MSEVVYMRQRRTPEQQSDIDRANERVEKLVVKRWKRQQFVSDAKRWVTVGLVIIAGVLILDYGMEWIK